MIMEKVLDIGDKFTFRGSSLRVEPATSNSEGGVLCEGCYFFEHAFGCYNDYQCIGENRPDGTDVIFKEIKED